MPQILNMKDIGSAIRLERRARSLTQAELARKACVTRQTIISLEAGEDSSIFTLMRVVVSMGLCIKMEPILPDYVELGKILDES